MILTLFLCNIFGNGETMSNLLDSKSYVMGRSKNNFINQIHMVLDESNMNINRNYVYINDTKSLHDRCLAEKNE